MSFARAWRPVSVDVSGAVEDGRDMAANGKWVGGGTAMVDLMTCVGVAKCALWLIVASMQPEGVARELDVAKQTNNGMYAR
jgi:hypothetical protein